MASLPKGTLKRLAKKTPEVMVKVSGGGKTVQHVMKHLTYITRNGELNAETDKADKLASKDELKELMDEWGLDIAKGLGKNKLVFNVILSMPVGTDPHQLLKAAKDFARDQFYGTHQYLMVLHEPETDPSKKKADHPHVHLVIRAQGHDGQRLYIRKPMLQKWREVFAETPRDKGIDANATPRILRGVVRKSKNHAIKGVEKAHADARKTSTVIESKFANVRREVDNPERKGNAWDRLVKIKRKQLVRALSDEAKKHATEGDHDLATALQEFAVTLPHAITERGQMRANVQGVKDGRGTAKVRLAPNAEQRQDQTKTLGPNSRIETGPER